jgi:hypothetical protein
VARRIAHAEGYCGLTLDSRTIQMEADRLDDVARRRGMTAIERAA